jgi:hypothetical protein
MITYLVAVIVAVAVALGTIAGADLFGVSLNAAVAGAVGTIAGALWIVASRQQRRDR